MGASSTGRQVFWLLVLSLAFNVAFAASALYCRFAGCPSGTDGDEAVPAQGQELPAAIPAAPVTLKERLGMDDGQWEQFTQNREALQERVRELRKEVAGLKAQLWEQVASEAAEMATIRPTTARIAALQQQVQELVVEQMLKTRQMLRPDQRERFDRFLAEGTCKGPMCDGGCLGGAGGSCGQARPRPPGLKPPEENAGQGAAAPAEPGGGCPCGGADPFSAPGVHEGCGGRPGR
jgi:ribosomal protein L29